jgi:hypothetical protein
MVSELGLGRMERFGDFGWSPPSEPTGGHEWQRGCEAERAHEGAWRRGRTVVRAH